MTSLSSELHLAHHAELQQMMAQCSIKSKLPSDGLAITMPWRGGIETRSHMSLLERMI